MVTGSPQETGGEVVTSSYVHSSVSFQNTGEQAVCTCQTQREEPRGSCLRLSLQAVMINGESKAEG